MKWKNVLMPKQVEIQKTGETPYFTRFTVEPLERGFGLTLGNALRRTLLSSLQGAAVVAVKFEDALHEFTNIPGVMEDVSDIVLNFKQMVCRLNTDLSHKLYLDVNRPGPVTAADITEDSAVEIVNPDLVICHLNEGAHLRAEILVSDGRGFVLAENHELTDTSIGVIPVDAIFCPVRKVNYRIEDTRVGQRTDYDRLVLEIETNGAISPEEALGYAAKIVKDHLYLFINFDEEPMAVAEEEVDEELERMRELLSRNVEELELSVRSANCLKAADIKSIGQLVVKTESEMLQYRNFGRKSLKEISEILEGMGLHWGMDVSGLVASVEKERAQA
ncbi:MAG: DNA-directed RNA polymerase subunit alpha [Candidatus Latescibacteria bacterium]|nr:DNA-directed RNA polymerase subunit alpha [bacterium]MCB9512966.1 DNA-directed RNA polymerase subunit alpha [Candidatus Latescibacterota bacterium]MCB9516373.1 DNA-directed RNA polymerase subunit alpha [Candidatus Latescibacterota bacterium]